jgi:hypothetical protein
VERPERLEHLSLAPSCRPAAVKSPGDTSPAHYAHPPAPPLPARSYSLLQRDLLLLHIVPSSPKGEETAPGHKLYIKPKR